MDTQAPTTLRQRLEAHRLTDDVAAVHDALVADDLILGLLFEIARCDAVRLSASAERTVSAMGLQVNQVGNARISAGAPSRRTRFLRMASAKERVAEPKQGRRSAVVPLGLPHCGQSLRGKRRLTSSF